jgi:hypothetical protein
MVRPSGPTPDLRRPARRLRAMLSGGVGSGAVDGPLAFHD